MCSRSSDCRDPLEAPTQPTHAAERFGADPPGQDHEEHEQYERDDCRPRIADERLSAALQTSHRRADTAGNGDRRQWSVHCLHPAQTAHTSQSAHANPPSQDHKEDEQHEGNQRRPRVCDERLCPALQCGNGGRNSSGYVNRRYWCNDASTCAGAAGALNPPRGAWDAPRG